MIGIEVDLRRRDLRVDGAEVPLRRKAFDLLQYFVENRGRTLSFDELLREVWPGTIAQMATLKVTVSELRRAFGQRSGAQGPIRTHRGKGYAFIADCILVPERRAHGDAGSTRRARRRSKVAVLLDRVAPPSRQRRLRSVQHGLQRSLIAFDRLEVSAADPGPLLDRKRTTLSSVACDLGAEFLVLLAFGGLPDRPQFVVNLVDTCGAGLLLTDRFDLERALDLEVVAATLERHIVRHRYGSIPSVGSRTAEDYVLLGEAASPDGAEANSRSIRHFRLSLAMQEDNPKAWAGLAEAHFLNAFLQYSPDPDADLADAMKCATVALRQDARSSRASWIMGRILHLSRDWDIAEIHFRRAIALNPCSASAHAMMGSFLMHAGRNREAIPMLRRSISLSSGEDSRPYWALGAAYYNLELYGPALESLAGAVALRPGFSRPYRLIAACHAMGQRPGEAERIFKTRLRDDRTNTLSEAEAFMKRTTRAPQDVAHLLEGFRRAGLPE